MPLSKKEKRVLSKFIEEYGRKKGKKIFYAWENKRKFLTGGNNVI